MRYKSDWPEAAERLAALWQCGRLDRPCIAVTASSGRDVPRPTPPEDPRGRWLDPEYLVADALARLENIWWGGEAVPSMLLQAGWMLCLGGTPRFDQNTIWFETAEFDFDAPPAFAFDPTDPWVRRFEAAYLALAAAAGRDGFLVGQPCMLPASELLSMRMGTEAFLTALVDRPEWMARAIAQGARCQVAAREHFRRLLAGRHEFWYGNAGWMPFWTPQPHFATQSDVSCMLSPAMFDRFILPELELYGRRFGALWYHLDGRDARQHLPRLLSLPYVRVVQYTPAPCEPPNGPAHLELYRRIQAAGRIVHVELPRQNVEPLARELDPSLLMLATSCPSPAEGRRLLENAMRWTAAGSAGRGGA